MTNDYIHSFTKTSDCFSQIEYPVQTKMQRFSYIIKELAIKTICVCVVSIGWGLIIGCIAYFAGMCFKAGML